MKKAIFVLFILILTVANSAKAQSLWTELQLSKPNGEEWGTQINTYATYNLNESFGFFAWSLVSKGWSEAIIGPTYSPVSWFVIGAGAGIEAHESRPRYLGQMWLGNENWAFLAMAEDGASGNWYYTQAIYSTQTTSTGIWMQRNTGIGPLIEIRIIPYITLWSVPIAWDLEKRRGRNSVFTIKFTT